MSARPHLCRCLQRPRHPPRRSAANRWKSLLPDNWRRAQSTCAHRWPHRPIPPTGRSKGPFGRRCRSPAPLAARAQPRHRRRTSPRPLRCRSGPPRRTAPAPAWWRDNPEATRLGADLRTRRLRVVAPSPATDRDHAHQQHPARHPIDLLVTGRSELLRRRNPLCRRSQPSCRQPKHRDRRHHQQR